MTNNSEQCRLRDEIAVLRERVASLEALLCEKQDRVDAIRESEERLRLVVAASDLGTWDWIVPGGTVTFNRQWAHLLGLRPDEVESSVQAWEKLIHPDDVSHVMTSLRAHLDGETDSYETEHRLRHKSGAWIWVLDKGRVFDREGDGRPLRVCGSVIDITLRKQAEQKLVHFHQLMRYIIEHTRSAVAVHDRNMS